MIDPQLKKERYEALLQECRAYCENEDHTVTAMANVCAAIHTAMDYFWVGFYVVEGEQLVLGPFQGTVACTRIRRGRGVCGTAWAERRTLIVPDVEAFPGHIACSSLSRSEIVVPMFNAAGEVWAELDIDSTSLNTFDDLDAHYLEAIASLIPVSAIW